MDLQQFFITLGIFYFVVTISLYIVIGVVVWKWVHEARSAYGHLVSLLDAKKLTAASVGISAPVVLPMIAGKIGQWLWNRFTKRSR